MRLIDVLKKDSILSDINGSEKQEILDEMSTKLATVVGGVNRDALLELLLEREKLGSTGIGYGVAIPHAKIKGLDSIAVSFGRSLKGVDFQSMDGEPVHLFFLIVAPETSTVTHLKVLAAISGLLKDEDFRRSLLSATSGDDIYRIIIEEEEKGLKGTAL